MKIRREAGQVLPLLAVCLTVLMGFAGLAVDVSSWEYQQRQQQNATDAAALGGAQRLASAGCPSYNAAVAAAQTDAATNGYPNGGSVTVTVQNPPSNGPYAGTNCAVYVQIKNAGVSSFFSRLFGYPSMSESTEAVGVATPNNNGCFFLLSQTATFNLNGDVIVAPTCSFLSNSSTVETLGAVIDVANFGYAHSLDENLLSLFLKAQPMQMLPVADPCPEITQCAYLTNNPPSYSSCSVYYNASVLPTSVNPGCYSSFVNPVNGILTMNPGVYEFTGPVTNSGVLTSGTGGVTMYVTSTGGPVSFLGNVALALNPPTSGNTAGVLLYQVPGNTNPVEYNVAASLSLAGLVYAPSALGEILGQANVTFGQYTVFVFSNAALTAGVTLTLPGPNNGLSLIQQAVLAQ